MGIEIKKTPKKDNPEEFWNSGKLKLEDNETVTILVKSTRDTIWDGAYGKIHQTNVVAFSPDVEIEEEFFLTLPKGMGLENEKWYELTKMEKGFNMNFTAKEVTKDMQELNQAKDKKVSSPSTPTIPLKAPEIAPKTTSIVIPTNEEEEVLKAVRANEQFIINVRENLPWFHEWFKQNNIDISVDRVRGLAELL